MFIKRKCIFLSAVYCGLFVAPSYTMLQLVSKNNFSKIGMNNNTAVQYNPIINRHRSSKNSSGKKADFALYKDGQVVISEQQVRSALSKMMPSFCQGLQCQCVQKRALELGILQSNFRQLPTADLTLSDDPSIFSTIREFRKTITAIKGFKKDADILEENKSALMLKKLWPEQAGSNFIQAVRATDYCTKLDHCNRQRILKAKMVANFRVTSIPVGIVLWIAFENSVNLLPTNASSWMSLGLGMIAFHLAGKYQKNNADLFFAHELAKRDLAHLEKLANRFKKEQDKLRKGNVCL